MPKFEIPKLEKKRLPVLTAEELQQVMRACNVRDKAIVLFLADSALRHGEAIKLNWSDVDMSSGLVRVKQRKGKKDRSAVIGAKTRRPRYRPFTQTNIYHLGTPRRHASIAPAELRRMGRFMEL